MGIDDDAMPALLVNGQRLSVICQSACHDGTTGRKPKLMFLDEIQYTSQREWQCCARHLDYSFHDPLATVF